MLLYSNISDPALLVLLLNATSIEYYECNRLYLSVFSILVYEHPEDGTDVPKHVVAVKECTDIFVVCAFAWFCT